MRTNPCKDCHDRYVGCHASCGAYLAWAEQRREINQKMIAENKVIADVKDMHALSVKRSMSGQEWRRKERRKKHEQR